MADLKSNGSAAKSADLLYSVPAIGAYMGLTERQARYLCQKGTLPSFKIDGTVCASRSVIDEWLAVKRAPLLSTPVSSSSKSAETDDPYTQIARLGQLVLALSDRIAILEKAEARHG